MVSNRFYFRPPRKYYTPERQRTFAQNVMHPLMSIYS